MSKLVNWIEFNPKVQLKKDEEYPFVTMDYLKPGTRYVNANEKRKFTGGGAKFQSGDTLFARITPCLENGKIAQFVDENAINGAFSSTEFFIFRAIPGKYNPAFVYYLSQTNLLRKTAIKSMVGASGRQRAESNVLKELEIKIPSLKEQTRIAAILSAYDDLIANNRRRMQLLETAARRLYRHHFAPASPKPWTGHWAVLGEVAATIGGDTPSTSKPEYWGGDIAWVTPTDVTRNDCLVLLDTEKKITEAGLKKSSTKMLPPETILMTSHASIGYFALMDKPTCTNQGFISVIPNKENLRAYLLFNLMERVEEIRTLATGTTFKEISKNHIPKYKNILSK